MKKRYMCVERCQVNGVRMKIGSIYEFEKNPRPTHFIPVSKASDSLTSVSLKEAVAGDLGLTDSEYSLVLAVRKSGLSDPEIKSLCKRVGESLKEGDHLTEITTEEDTTAKEDGQKKPAAKGSSHKKQTAEVKK